MRSARSGGTLHYARTPAAGFAAQGTSASKRRHEIVCDAAEPPTLISTTGERGLPV
jgi:hypothetical protein